MSEPSQTKDSKTDTKTNPTTKAPSSHKTLFIILGVVILIFVILPGILFVSGVAFVRHRLGESGIKVNNTTKSVTIKGSNGDEITAGSSKTLPKDFPSSVTIYKGTLLSSGRLTIEGRVNWSASVETTDNSETVSKNLTETFSSNGWTTDLNNQTTEGGVINAHNDQFTVNVYYGGKDGKTQMTYTVMPVTGSSSSTE